MVCWSRLFLIILTSTPKKLWRCSVRLWPKRSKAASLLKLSALGIVHIFQNDAIYSWRCCWFHLAGVYCCFKSECLLLFHRWVMFTVVSQVSHERSCHVYCCFTSESWEMQCLRLFQICHVYCCFSRRLSVSECELPRCECIFFY